MPPAMYSHLMCLVGVFSAPQATHLPAISLSASGVSVHVQSYAPSPVFCPLSAPVIPLFTPHTSHTLRAASHVPPLRPAPCRRNYGPTIPRTHHIRRPHLPADVLLPISRPATGLVPNEDHFDVSICRVRYRILRATPSRSLAPTPPYVRLPC